MWSLIALAAAVAADPMAQVRSQEAVLGRVGYRLASRNAALCGARGHPTGLFVERIVQYPGGDRAAMMAAGLGAQPAIVLVVPDSPAAMAGLRVGDQILALNGVAVAADDVARTPVDAEAGARFDALLETALADGSAALSVLRGGQPVAARLTAPPGCPARFAVRLIDRLASSSNGLTIQVSWGAMQLAKTDDELAALVAHEMAHNILRHPQTLKALGWPRKQVKATERDADRLSIYLLHAAGYPLADGIGFMERLLRKTDWGFFSDGTHPGWRERIAAMNAERARIEGMAARGEPVRPPVDLMP